MVRQKQSSKLKEILLSNKKIENHISEMSNEILLQIAKDLRFRPQFSLQLDKSNDVSSYAQLLVYAGYISGNNIQKQYRFSELLSSTCKREDIFKTVKLCFEKQC